MHFRDFGTGGDTSSAVTADQAAAACTRVRNFWLALASVLPVAVNVLVESEVEVIEDSTGTLVNTFATPGTSAVSGSGAGAFSAATGAVVNWRTNGIRNGRRVRGRTFLVPLNGAAFAATGQLGSGIVTTITTAASALADGAGSPDLFVYGRPSAVGAADGVSYVVSSASVPAMGAILTSRRD